MLLLTNNEKFKQIENELNSNKLNLEYQDITYIEILEKARDLIHKGYKLYEYNCLLFLFIHNLLITYYK